MASKGILLKLGGVRDLEEITGHKQILMVLPFH